MLASKGIAAENTVESVRSISDGAKRIVRYCAEGLAIVGLVGGLYWYMEFINTVPDCAVENHHGAGNCPVQLLAWYPKSLVQSWDLSNAPRAR